jgi:hypothetical protein
MRTDSTASLVPEEAERDRITAETLEYKRASRPRRVTNDSLTVFAMFIGRPQ